MRSQCNLGVWRGKLCAISEGALRHSLLKSGTVNGCLSAHGHADGLAPLPDAVVADSVDSAVGPFRGCGGEGEGVGVVRRAVVGEEGEARAGTAIDFSACPK